MGCRAVARGCVVERVGLGLRLGDEILDVLVALGRRDHEHVRQVRERRDAVEVLQRVVRQLRIDRRIDEVAAAVDEEGVAVGRGLRDQGGP